MGRVEGSSGYSVEYIPAEEILSWVSGRGGGIAQRKNHPPLKSGQVLVPSEVEFSEFSPGTVRDDRPKTFTFCRKRRTALPVLDPTLSTQIESKVKSEEDGDYLN